MHLRTDEIIAGLTRVDASPRDNGTLEMIVRRPAVGEREVIETGELDPAVGLIGDTWRRRMRKGAVDLDTQLTLMNSRFIDLIAQNKSRWALAGDQLFVDLNLSRANLPPGTRLDIGAAILEVTAEPHTGCAKFVSRFGRDAMTLVNSALGEDRQLRGIYAKVAQGGVVRVGDVVSKRGVWRV